MNVKNLKGEKLGVHIEIENDGKKPGTAEQLVKQTRNVFHSKKTKMLSFRKKQLQGLILFLEAEEQNICEALYKDLRKHRSEALVHELNLVKAEAKFALRHLNKWAQPECVTKTVANIFDNLRIYSDPYGVILVIGAWNFPVFVLLAPVVGAIAAGNCVVIKPSECAPATSQVMSNLLPKYIDKECYPVYTGGVEETTELLNQRFDYIFFTGSTQIGKIVHQAASKYMTPTTLELGGKNAVYIDKTANMKVATKRIIWGKTQNAGQICLSPDYILCNKEVQEKFIEYAQEVLVELYGVDIKRNGDYGRIINQRHFNRLCNLLKHQKVAIGGQVDANELFIHPTVLVDVDIDDPIMHEEIFGPILPIINVESEEEAINFINAREKCLVLYIFTTKASVKKAFLENTSSGGALINDTIMHVAAEGLPFGGVGNSGMGAYLGKKSFDTFTHKKSVLEKGFSPVSEKLQSVRYPPYTKFKVDFIETIYRFNFALSARALCHVCVFGLGVAATVGAYYLNKYIKNNEE